MNNEFISQIVSIYDSVLYDVGVSNPEKARRCFNSLNYTLVTLINFYELSDIEPIEVEILDLPNIVEYLSHIEFISLAVKNIILELSSLYEIATNNMMKIVSKHKNELNSKSMYHALLALDITVFEGCYQIVYDNKARDRAGAYYTTEDFASLIVNKVLYNYISNKSINIHNIEELTTSEKHEILQILMNTKVADLSCGTGSFIMAYIDFINKLEINNEDLIKLMTNIYAFDIDLVALQVLKVQMLKSVNDISFVSLINKNLVIGNTLLNYNIDNYEEKIQLILSGYIYHEKLGINQDIYSDYFDIILGNPPWEKIRFEDKNFFSNYSPEIAAINKSNDRKLKIAKLAQENLKLKDYYVNYSTQIEVAKGLIKDNMNFQYSALGELNTNSLFTEQAINFLNTKGVIGLVVKSSLINTAANSKIFNYLVNERLVVSIHDFINKEKIFPIDSRERFAVIVLSKYATGIFKLNMLLKKIDDIKKDGFPFNKELLYLINPNNGMIPNVSGEEDIRLLNEFYNNFNTFEYEYPESKFGRLVHLTSHASHIHKLYKEGTLQIYEGKFIEIYDNKYSTFDGIDEVNCYSSKASARLMNKEEKNNIDNYPKCRYFIDQSKWNDITKNYVEDYSVMWRSLTSASNRRTMIASILPHMPTIQSVQLLQYGKDNKTLLLILSLFNSIVFDYLVKLKLSGIDLTQAVIKQIPVPARSKFKEIIIYQGIEGSFENHIISRIEKLYKYDVRLKSLFNDISYEGFKPNVKSKEYKELVIELDCLIAKAYNLSKSEFHNILLKFEKFYSKDEIKKIDTIYW